MKLALAAVFCCLLGSFAMWLWGPSVWSDLQLRGEALQRSPHYVIDKARCRRKAFVISVCDIRLKPASGGRGLQFDYFIPGDVTGEPVHILANREGGAVTTNIGVDHAVNRALMLLAFGGGMLILGVSGAVRMLRRG